MHKGVFVLLKQEDEENKLFQFLMGSNEVYVGVRSNLLMMQPPPTLDSAYNILLSDEKQRQVPSNSRLNSDSMSFNVNTNAKMCSHPGVGPVPAFNHSTPPPRQYPQRINFEQNKVTLFCKYCKKSGHLIDKCFNLYGFPQNSKVVKGKRGAAHSAAGSEHGNPEFNNSDSAPNFNEGPTSITPAIETQNSVILGLTKQ
ncbi:uncharacterized protein [Nicotiana sylvestris]|uniref:uncharacterized protein isoform X1 n=1 Tax=Nicotiana sylvestris TaxID=4096 RepID=UPI00388CBABF